MEVKPGYKLTDVGVIPVEWSATTVGNEFTIQLGKMLDTQKNVGVPKLYLGNRAIQWGRIELVEVGSIRMTPSDLQRYRLRNGDLLVCEGGEIGRAAIWKEPIEECYYQKALHRLRPLRGCNIFLMLCMLRRLASTGILLNFATKTSIAHLPKDQFKKVPLALPSSIVEQEAIAQALNDADAFIDSLEQLIAKKRVIKRGAMRELLTSKKRLPGFAGEWKTRSLGEVIGHCSSGATPYRGRSDYYNGNIKWISSGELNYNTITDTREKITVEAVEKTNLKTHPAGTFLMAITGMEAAGTRGACGIVGSPAATNQSCMAIYPTSELSTQYLFHYYICHGDELALRYCQGTKQQSYTAQLVRILPIRLPASIAEQNAIAAALSDMDAEIAALETKLSKACQIREGVARSLLTGEIRLDRPAAQAASPIPVLVENGASRATAKRHSPAFNEAVLISCLAAQFGTPVFPLGRKRYTKLAYLIHRKTEGEPQGYLKKAAGPYNPQTRYGGSEQIAEEKGYLRKHKAGARQGFIAGENIEEAKRYLAKWYGPEITAWAEQFRFNTNDDLECLTTVEMAMRDLTRTGCAVDVKSVRGIIVAEPEWRPKLERDAFSEPKIEAAIVKCRELFS